jgi:hypothetical protein
MRDYLEWKRAQDMPPLSGRELAVAGSWTSVT